MLTFLAGYRIVFTTFKEDSAAACNVMQFGYSFGGIVAPFIMSQFVDGRFSDINFMDFGRLYNRNGDNSTILINVTVLPPVYPGRFMAGYWIIAALGFVIVTLIVSLHFFDLKTKRNLADYSEVKDTLLKEELSPRSCSKSKPVIAALFLLMLFVFVGCMFPITRVYGKIIFSYDRDGPGLSVEESSLMTSSKFLGAVGGILIFVIPTIYIHVKYILQVSFMHHEFYQNT